MAAPKKTTKPAVAKNDTEIETVAVEKEVVEEKVEVAPPTVKTFKKFQPDEAIECRSVTAGELILIGPKTKLQYTWSDYGDTAYVEFQDLQALQSRKSNFIIKPRFIIEDEELVEQWSNMLKPIYDKIHERDLDTVFNLPVERFKAVLQSVPDGLRETIKTMAVQRIQSEELYDIRKVRAIDEVFGTDFVEMYLK